MREAVSDTLADAAVSSPRAAAHDKVQGAMQAWQAQEHHGNPDLSVTQFHIIEQHLRQLPQGDETENLKSYMNAKSREQAMWLDQAQLVQTGARP
jgi:hypothetical protein